MTTRWQLAAEAADDLERLTNFLLESAPEAALDTVEIILDGLGILASHPLVGRVGHPLLESHPSHALAQKLLKHGAKGAGAVFSFDIKGSRQQGKAFIEALKLFSHLANVGDCRSLVIHPASTTHRQLSEDAQVKAGAAPDTVRLSIGIEDVRDIIADLDQALAKATA